jgi:hypothetical protein
MPYADDVIDCCAGEVSAMTEDSTRWQRAATAMETEVRAWRRAHPEATLTDIEQALDVHLDAARAALVAEMAVDVPDEDERCPDCGGALLRRGTRRRTLRTRGDTPVALTRSYRWCPACEAGRFPPR